MPVENADEGLPDLIHAKARLAKLKGGGVDSESRAIQKPRVISDRLRGSISQYTCQLRKCQRAETPHLTAMYLD